MGGVVGKEMGVMGWEGLIELGLGDEKVGMRGVRGR
jgi:hypothetical protein